MTGSQVWVVGHHAVEAVLQVNPERALSLWVVKNQQNAATNNIINRAQQLGIAVQTVNKEQLSEKCQNQQHQGVALQAKPKQIASEQQLLHFCEHNQDKALLFLVLDQVQDPHNFGACLRTADAAGADGVIITKDNSSPITPVVQKVASGAVETTTIYRVTNLARTMDSMKSLGVWFVGTSDKATENLYQQNLTGSIGMVMGAEGKGLRSLTSKTCDNLVQLPMAGSIVSSLNVSVATGVCLYEVVRQRSFK